MAPIASASLKQICGNVQVIAKDGSSHDASATDYLTSGDSLKTGKDGSVELAMAGSGAARLAPNSEVKLPEKKDKAPIQESLQMLRGKLFFDVDAAALKKQGNREFRLKTPAVVLAVKGTRFFAAISATGETAGVQQGEVSILNPVSKQTQTLRAGMAADIVAGKPVTPRPLRQEEMCYGAFYPGDGESSFVIPIGEGGRWLMVGNAMDRNGNSFYYNEFGNVMKVNSSGQRSTVFKLTSLNGSIKRQEKFGDNDGVWLMSLATDGKGGVYFTDRKSIYHVDESSGRAEHIYTPNLNELSKVASVGGKERKFFWSGTFAFGRTAEGMLDTKTLYLVDQYGATSIWRVTQNQGVWGTATRMTEDDLKCRSKTHGHIPVYFGGMIMAGPSEAYIWSTNGSFVARLTNWKDPESLYEPSSSKGVNGGRMSFIEEGEANKAGANAPPEKAK